jgi:hypothetical protein
MQFLLVNVVDLIALALFFYLLIAFRDHRRRQGLPYPPGPPPWPIIGNLLDVPKKAPWVGYANMSKKHGIVAFLEQSLAQTDVCVPRRYAFSSCF